MRVKEFIVSTGVAYLAFCLSIFCDRRASLFTNIFHIGHRVLSLFSGEIHNIDVNDMKKIDKQRFLYTLTTIAEKRYFESISKEIITIPAVSGHQIPCALYIPKLCMGIKCPIVIYLHGGGWVLGGIDMYEHITTAIATKSQVNALFIDYRLGEYSNSLYQPPHNQFLQPPSTNFPQGSKIVLRVFSMFITIPHCLAQIRSA
jgi:hypothetical protein